MELYMVRKPRIRFVCTILLVSSFIYPSSSTKCSKFILNEVLNLNRGGSSNINIPPPPPPPPPPVEANEISKESTEIAPPKTSSLSSILKRKILRDKLSKYEKELDDSKSIDKSTEEVLLLAKTVNGPMPFSQTRTIPFYNHYHTILKEFKSDSTFLVFPIQSDYEKQMNEKNTFFVNSTRYDKDDQKYDTTNTQEKTSTTSEKHTITSLLLLQTLYEKQQQSLQNQFIQFEQHILKILATFNKNYEQQQEHYQSTLLHKLQLLLYDNSEMLLQLLQEKYSKLLETQESKILQEMKRTQDEYHQDIVQKLNEIIRQDEEFEVYTKQKRNEERKRYISLLDSLDDDGVGGNATTSNIVDSEEQQDSNTENEVFENVLWDLMVTNTSPLSEDDDEYESSSDYDDENDGD